jgi:hypothetical protein
MGEQLQTRYNKAVLEMSGDAYGQKPSILHSQRAYGGEHVT